MAKDMYQKRKERKEKNKGVENKANINWYPGHMAKTKRLIRENLEYIDIVLELVDARIPFSSHLREIDDIIMNKPKLLIMTKKDLCDQKETSKWVKYYTELNYKVILMDLEHDFNSKTIINAINELMKPINQIRENKNLLARKPRVLVVGVPNVGKSTLINHLVGKKVTNVGNKPGITKDLNWIRVNDNFELLDTPGLLWPKIDEGNIAYNLATFTAIREEVLPLYDIIGYIFETLEKYYPNILKDRYGIDEVNDYSDAMELIGRRRGALIKGGEVDFEKVMSMIMSDFKLGYVKGVTFDRCEE